MVIPKSMFISLEALWLFLFPMARGVLAQAAGSPPLSFMTLRDHVGAAEKVHLDVYCIGFPAELQADIQGDIRKTLTSLHIEDAKPWWIPN